MNLIYLLFAVFISGLIHNGGENDPAFTLRPDISIFPAAAERVLNSCSHSEGMQRRKQLLRGMTIRQTDGMYVLDILRPLQRCRMQLIATTKLPVFVCLFVFNPRISVCLSVSVSVCLSVSLCLCLCLPACLPVCLAGWLAGSLSLREVQDKKEEVVAKKKNKR